MLLSAIVLTGRIINSSAVARAGNASEPGDGGIVATATDFTLFMDALMKRRLISDSSVREMVRGKTTEAIYGLGVQLFFHYGNERQYGHLGAELGAASLLLFYARSRISLYLEFNADNSFNGRIPDLMDQCKEEIAQVLAKE